MSFIIVTATGFAYGGFAAISITIDRHYADVHGRSAELDAQTRNRFRLLGWLSLMLAFAACITAYGWHTGPVLWCGLLTASAIVLTLLLQYAPLKAITIAKISYAIALLTACLWIFFR